MADDEAPLWTKLQLSAVESLPEKAHLCRQRGLFVFVGNAERLGRLHIPDQTLPLFGKEFVAAWQDAELRRAVSYHGKIEERLKDLTDALAHKDAECTKPEVLREIKEQGGDGPGGYTFIAITDGPNHALDGGKLVPVKADSHIKTWNFRHDSLKWNASSETDWTVGPNGIVAAGSSGKEFILPQAIDAVLANVETIRKHYYQDDKPFSHSVYYFKSHGATLETQQALGTPIED
jgi:hypothetical protein